MLKSLFGSVTRERVLAFIAARESGYALEISTFWQCAPTPVKRALNGLESSGILVAESYGRTTTYKLNPRLYIRKELMALMMRVIEAYPPELKERLLYDRRRPRAKGKLVRPLSDSARDSAT